VVEFASSREAMVMGEVGEAAAEVNAELVVMMTGVGVAMDAPGLAVDVVAAIAVGAVPEADPVTPAAPSVPAAGVEVKAEVFVFC
jgi:hypothetical protein